MKIGIDISQTVFQNTGVSNYLLHLVSAMISDTSHEYVLFASSLRGDFADIITRLKRINESIVVKHYKIPPILLDVLWNRLHIMPIENLIGDVDIFLSSDWTEPPVKKAKKATIIYDLIVYKYPEETNNQIKFKLKNLLISPNIVASQKRKLLWVKRESDLIFCISQNTKEDIKQILQIAENRLHVLYPGFSI